VTKKITLRMECKDCKYKLQLALKRCKHFEIGAPSKHVVSVGLAPWSCCSALPWGVVNAHAHPTPASSHAHPTHPLPTPTTCRRAARASKVWS